MTSVFDYSISNDPTGAAVITATDSSCITDYLIVRPIHLSQS